MINEGFCIEFFFLEPPEILKCFCLISTQGLIFLYNFLVFFSSLAMISHLPSIVFAFGNFHFGPMGKTATCLTPGIGDFGHWFWKICRDVHNLQPFNGLISKKKKKKKAVAISHLDTTMWLTKVFLKISYHAKENTSVKVSFQ